MTRVLLVEDDHGLAGGLVRGLKAAGFEVELLTTGADVVRTASASRFDLIVLDLMLPERTGFEVLEQLQARTSPPVIVLTARTELDDRLRSFSLGAADYVSKPFWIEELVARIRTRLRVTDQPSKRVVTAGALAIDLDARQVAVAGEIVKLTRTEYDLLVYLAERPGRAIERGQLASLVVASMDDVGARTIDAHVTRIRKKLGACGACVGTVWGIGYRFDPEAAS